MHAIQIKKLCLQAFRPQNRVQMYSKICIFIFSGYHNPKCTEIDALQSRMDGPCGSSYMGGSNTPASMGPTGTGNRSNRSRRGSSRGTNGPIPGGPDSIDIIDHSKEKTVNFANCVSPPSPHDPGFMGINNEAYPCDCCQIDESQFRRSYSHQMPCGPSGMMHFSEVRQPF